LLSDHSTTSNRDRRRNRTTGPDCLPDAADQNDQSDLDRVREPETERRREDHLARQREDEGDQKRVDGDDAQSRGTRRCPDRLFDDLELEEPLQDPEHGGGHYAALPLPLV
jgi:hypothetical protein